MASPFPTAASRPLQVRAAHAGPRPCKVCGADADLFGVHDFNRCCEEHRGVRLPLAGVPVYYRRCGACGLMFTDAFDDWSDEDFAAHIYNDGYGQVDRDFEVARPVSNARQVAGAFGSARAGLSILDYGGGNGRFAQELQGAGFAHVVTYDRFHPAHSERPGGRFRLVTCYETIEHMPDPVGGARDIASFLAPDGLLIVSTMVQPPDIAERGMSWWYIGPRNGHITLFTHEALAILFGRLGLRLLRSIGVTHLFCREVPEFARALFPPDQR